MKSIEDMTQDIRDAVIDLYIIRSDLDDVKTELRANFPGIDLSQISRITWQMRDVQERIGRALNGESSND
jgi:hypothetical protein